VTRPASRLGVRTSWPTAGRVASLLATGALVTVGLAGCGSSANGSALSLSTTSANPSPTVSVSAALAAQAKAAQADFMTSVAKLNAQYSWLPAALGTGSLAAKTPILFQPARKAMSDAKGTMSSAAKAARAAAQASPKDCGTVAAQRARSNAAYSTGVAAYNAFVPQASQALAGLAAAPALRKTAQADGAALTALAQAHPELGINAANVSAQLVAHTPSDDAVLLTATQKAQSDLSAASADLAKVNGNVAQIAPTCG
jgi:hypothetical protein